jgi:hypothetical protein
MKKFTHLILTRYNVGLYTDNPYNIEDPDKWMAERFDLFRKTYNSVENQTSLSFRWVIFYDDKTPKKFIERLRLFFELPHVRFVPFSKFDEIKSFNYGSEFILTTRLDNDDLISPNFIDSVQSEFCEKEGVIDTKGTQLDSETGKSYTVERRYPNSPFITLVERFDTKLKTVFHKTHSDLHKDYDWNKYIKGEPLYTQVIHSSNVANKITGKEL